MSDTDRVERQYRNLSYSRREEVTANVISFTAWLRAVEALADLWPHAVKLYNWIKSKF